MIKTSKSCVVPFFRVADTPIFGLVQRIHSMHHRILESSKTFRSKYVGTWVPRGVGGVVRPKIVATLINKVATFSDQLRFGAKEYKESCRVVHASITDV